jgi:N-acetylglucosamine malate deacetylase 2
MLAAEDLLRRATAPQGATEAMPHAIVVVAHADDETIALGGRMGRFQKAHFIHITDGAPRNEQDSRAHGFSTLDDYRAARKQELKKMFAKAGLAKVSHTSLGFRDQEATLNLVEITRQLVQRISQYGPEVILTHPYEGGHPDHDACAFAVHHAVGLHRERGGARPLIVEAPFYNLGPKEPGSGAFLDVAMTMPEVVYQLSREERERKHALIACFTTQKETLKGFHDSTERYRIAPMYDFTRPPHAGELLYDHYPWGMTSDRFCELAEEAEERLRNGNGAP